jgi:hypothetical protein
MTLEERLENQSTPAISHKRKASPLGRSPKATKNIVKGYGAVTDLENKLFDVQRENKELLKEIKLLQRIQDRQGNALDQISQEGLNERQINGFMSDLRVQKE